MRLLRLPALITFFGVGLLVALGSWQLVRLSWKTDLIARLDARTTLPPLELSEALAMDPQSLEFRRVHVTGEFMKGQDFHLIPRTRDGVAGAHLITPMQAGDAVVLVDRGWVPYPRDALVVPPQPTIGMIRLPEPGNFFTPQNDFNRKLLYRLTPIEIAEHLSIKKLAPLYIALEAPQKTALRNFHLQYALTWYTLALFLIGIYFISMRRLAREKDEC